MEKFFVCLTHGSTNYYDYFITIIALIVMDCILYFLKIH